LSYTPGPDNGFVQESNEGQHRPERFHDGSVKRWRRGYNGRERLRNQILFVFQILGCGMVKSKTARHSAEFFAGHGSEHLAELAVRDDLQKRSGIVRNLLSD